MLFTYLTDLGKPFGLDPESHLGGYIKGGDKNTFCVNLWNWAIDEFKIKSIIDIGCGEGHSTYWFEQQGCHTIGIEGSDIAIKRSKSSSILCHDYSKGSLIIEYDFDMAWSCEFVEHVDEKFINNFLITFTSANIIMMTHALPNQTGYHHVNCQPPDYWINRFKSIGYQLDQKNTDIARSIDPHTFFAKSGLIFKRFV